MGWNRQTNRHFINKSVIRSGPVAERGALEPIRTAIEEVLVITAEGMCTYTKRFFI